jgi:hypothetical protein
LDGLALPLIATSKPERIVLRKQFGKVFETTAKQNDTDFSVPFNWEVASAFLTPINWTKRTASF